MNKQINKIMLVGDLGIGTLAQSYKVAFEGLGYEVCGFDINSAVEKYCRFGALGCKFNAYVPVESWGRKANREMVVKARQFTPQVVVVVGRCPVSPGALAQMKASLEVTLVHIWPDPLLWIDSSLIECLPLYDLECVYSRNAVKPLQNLGAARPVWIPLAGDPSIHSAPQCLESREAKYGADVTFIGGWRPEREAILSTLAPVNLKIWGPDWGRRCKKNRTIMKAWQGRPLRCHEFVEASVSSKINLNIIDQTNYPAANMRFFEIPCAGGLQVCSPCPEMATEFKHDETIFYFEDEKNLARQIEFLLNKDELRQEVKQAAHHKVIGQHTYQHRTENILNLLNDWSMLETERS